MPYTVFREVQPWLPFMGFSAKDRRDAVLKMFEVSHDEATPEERAANMMINAMLEAGKPIQSTKMIWLMQAMFDFDNVVDLIKSMPSVPRQIGVTAN